MAFPGPSAEQTAARARAWWRDRVREVFRATDQTARFADFEAFFAELFAHFAAPAAWEAAADALDALHALRAGGRLVAVASNFDQRLPAVLAGLGLDRALDAVLLPAELGAAKPDPAFFAAVAERLGIAPEAAVYVGDDAEQDRAAARRAGWRAMEPGVLATLPDRIRALEETAAP